MRLNKNTKLVLVFKYDELIRNKDYIIEKWMKFYQSLTINEEQKIKHQKGPIYFVFNNIPKNLTKNKLA